MKKQPTLHESIIDLACRNGWQRIDWKTPIRQLLKRAPYRDDADIVESALTQFMRAADAWRIVEEQPGIKWAHSVVVIELLEVDVNHPITPEKLNSYTRLWYALDCSEYFHLRVYRADRFGMVTPYLDETNCTQVLMPRPTELRYR